MLILMLDFFWQMMYIQARWFDRSLEKRDEFQVVFSEYYKKIQ